ncbi:hypothetical protein ACYZTX_29410 [Pseudomonas sp. MDT1-17]
MTLSTAARRPPAQQFARTQDDERQRQAFQQWLKPAPLNDSPAPSEQTPSQRAHQALTLELEPYQTHLTNLGQFAQATLTLRLTNGPLAGLEICATVQTSTLHLQVRTPDRARFEQIAGSCRALESELARRFNRPIILEVHDASAATE